ncbi:acetylornithine deacetylase (ArgE) [Labrys sp. WJW]|uniref:acetylornithine deacetylase n=1 Tax=Labrys sp. WJW TaxID=1737983 RepID=UPI00082990DE|nr:acetylornithine deacetylase [Labrys sp. WJW]OCC04822.1 acetylornithine deacetylase (ArgE) [Labrys sp. WJW]
MPARYTPAELTAKLVSFDTVSSRSNLALIDFVADYLAGHGVESIRLPNATGDKAALLATIGPTDRPGVVLSGHVDVVPVEGQAWTAPAFEARLEGERLYGRGTCDMKGFVATALALVPDFLAMKLKAPVHIAISYDEEISCLGSLDMIARFDRDLPLPRACIVGEPTLMEVVDAQKSLAGYLTRITGRPAHSAMPALGANALHAAARIVSHLDDIADELQAAGDPSGRFEPGYSTVQAGLIQAGKAINIVPDEARIVWECRGLPSLPVEFVPDRIRAFSQEIVLPRLRRNAPEADIVTELDVAVPALSPEPGSYAETLALRLAGRNRTQAVSYGTEAGHFQLAGIPTVICGPGSIKQAHGADEWIALSELEACASFLRRLGQTLEV